MQSIITYKKSPIFLALLLNFKHAPGVNDPIRTLLKTTASVVGIRIR